MKINVRLGALALFIAAFVAVPAWAQFAATATTNATYAIKGGKVFTLTGAPIENGTVIIRDGKIAAVGANIAVPDGAQVIDATGLEVYPGIVRSGDADRSYGSERGERDAGYRRAG